MYEGYTVNCSNKIGNRPSTIGVSHASFIHKKVVNNTCWYCVLSTFVRFGRGSESEPGPNKIKDYLIFLIFGLSSHNGSPARSLEDQYIFDF